MDSLKIFSGRANQELSKAIAKNLNIELGKIAIKSFADREIYVQLQEIVRGKDVFLIQPTCNPANYNLMETITIISQGLHRYDNYMKDAHKADCRSCQEIWRKMMEQREKELAMLLRELKEHADMGKLKIVEE